MSIEFDRIITLLRKERGITQKQAAQDLGISQAQLSHYEKGIRECGLDFVVQVADYYGVSCDYLLGRSAERSGQTIRVEDLPDTAAVSDSIYRGSVLPVMYKKLIENSLDILFDKLENCRDKNLVTSVSQYLMLAVYKMFRHLYQAAPRNVASLFRVSAARWEGYSDAAMHLAEGDVQAALGGETGTGAAQDATAFGMTTESLAKEYPRHATSLLNLIKTSEEKIQSLQRPEH
jgi:transcriptional regulator with XRE-family HTH domain